MNFIPETPKDDHPEVPFFDDVTSEGGWQGHSTSKSIDTLKSEISQAIPRLGGLVGGFQRGTFIIGDRKRAGYQIHYHIERPDGQLVRGRIDVAALPVKEDRRLRRSYDARRQKSLKMALYMLWVALEGTWFLQQLSPGYAPLMPWMLADGEKTITELWSESATMGNLLPRGDSEFEVTEGEYREI
jgi:hypothetical protein